MSDDGVARVKRDALAPYLTCPLCRKLLREATTITECLHTFCRSCIHKKLTDEGMKRCPVCNVDLGCVPLEKLRSDPYLQDIRAKIFPKQMRKVNSPATLPAKRKERSLSSSVIGTASVPTQSVMTRRRSKFLKQNSASGETSIRAEVDHRKPLNDLVEVANSNRGVHDKKKPKGRGRKRKVQDEETSSEYSPSESERPRKMRRGRPRKTTNTGECKITQQPVVDAASAKLDPKKYPIWFSLVALNKEGEDYPPLPQIPANYIRIKDGNMSVSFIQKYLKAKLHLKSEEEVEILFMGQRLSPSLSLNKLVDLWLHVTVRDRISVTVGSSAKDFVMVLGYTRRVANS